jgi:hypothetical protein
MHQHVRRVPFFASILLAEAVPAYGASDPIGHWKLDETSAGPAYSFDGTNDHVDLGTKLDGSSITVPAVVGTHCLTRSFRWREFEDDERVMASGGKQ